MLAVGGWSYNGILLEDVFKQATETEEKRKKLVDSIMELCEEYQFDGIDLDWASTTFSLGKFLVSFQ